MGSQCRQKMFKIILSVFISLLVLEQVSGKKCYNCAWYSDSEEDSNCGDFDDSTPTCPLPDGGSCLKVSGKFDGEKGSVHTCDYLIDEEGEDGLCSGQKNKCKKQTVDWDEEITAKVCCCDGDLCNSGSFLYGSVLVVVSAILAQWMM